MRQSRWQNLGNKNFHDQSNSQTKGKSINREFGILKSCKSSKVLGDYEHAVDSGVYKCRGFQQGIAIIGEERKAEQKKTEIA